VILLATGLASVSQIDSLCQIQCRITKFWHLSTGVGGGGAGGATAPPKVLIWWKFGQNPRKSQQNLWKPSQNFWKSEQNLENRSKNGAQNKMKSSFLEVTFSYRFSFRVGLREFGQKFFAPRKICLLLHRCSWVSKGDVTRLRHK